MNECPQCGSDRIVYDICSYWSGVVAPDGGREELTEEMNMCEDCKVRFASEPRNPATLYTPATLLAALEGLRRVSPLQGDRGAV